MYNTSRCAEIEERFPGLIRAIVNAHTIQSKDEAQSKETCCEKTVQKVSEKQVKSCGHLLN